MVAATALGRTALQAGAKAFGTEAAFLLVMTAIKALVVGACLLVNTWAW